MLSEVQTAKKQLRQRVSSVLKGIDAAVWREQSITLQQRIREHPVWRQSRKVLLYASLRCELDVSGLIMDAFASNKKVAFPRFDPETGGYMAATVAGSGLELAPGHLGILEPPGANPILPMNQLDFILVPGVAFDLSGHRLGRGKGFYDRLLSDATGVKCGVGLDEQIQPEIPHETHDIILNCLVTPTRWIEFGEHKS